MSDRNQLANEKKALLDEAKVIETNANVQIEAVQKSDAVVTATAQIQAIQKEAQEQLKPKSERITAINNELLTSIDEEAGIVND